MTTTEMKESTQSAQSDIVERVCIRFAGDSGDGVQLTGSLFTTTSAYLGNDLATFPDFPAEIRAPAGTVGGVSGFQIQIGSFEIFTPGDRPDVLVAMNPAALKANSDELEPGALVIINKDAFTSRAFKKAGYDGDPMDQVRERFRVIEVPLTTLTLEALKESDLSHTDKERCKNFCALGLIFWMYERSLDYTLKWLETKFAKKPNLIAANSKVLQTGYSFGETTELIASTYKVPPASIESGRYRRTTGNEAFAMGFVAASKLSGLGLFLGSYPITPASDILHALSRYKNFGVRTFQAEDEIAAVSAAIGASYGGQIGLTTSSGPGIALKAEAIGLAMMTELPLVVINVQRGGPSTGLPTKTEQSDLLQALYGRNGESPLPVIAPSTPSDCFDVAIEAVRIATTFMTPVMVLSDGYIANGAEPWKIPKVDSLPDIKVTQHTEPEGFEPYLRDPETLARPWAVPGTPGLEHRIGGLEKSSGTGEVSYDPKNHSNMVNTRAEKIQRIAQSIPDAKVYGDADGGDVLLVGWGGTFGALRATAKNLRSEGLSVSHLQLRHINPMARNAIDVMKSFKTVLVCELNGGQLNFLLRGLHLLETMTLNKIEGRPFKVAEVTAKVKEILED